ncbi:hypothetical protein [Streptomyces sp. NPDC002156]
MPRRQLKVTVALATAAAASLSLAVAPAHSAPSDPVDPAVWIELAKTLEGTAKYQYAPFAVTDGYEPLWCSADPALGGTNYHYVNKKLYGSLDPAKPAALLYEDRTNEDWIDEASDTSWLDDLDALDGGTPPVAPSAATESRRLVAAEWIVLDKDQDPTTDDDRPSLFGVPFNGPVVSSGVPIHYNLQAWIWKKNPSGMFPRPNLAEPCPAA